MRSLSNVINLIKKDLYVEKKENVCHSFFYNSMLHYIISLEVASHIHPTNLLTFEALCKNIPKKFGCRSSIKTVLDHAGDEAHNLIELYFKPIFEIFRILKIKFNTKMMNKSIEW